MVEADKVYVIASEFRSALRKEDFYTNASKDLGRGYIASYTDAGGVERTQCQKRIQESMSERGA